MKSTEPRRGQPLKFGKQGRGTKVSVSLPAKVLAALDRRADRERKKRSAVVLEAVERHLADIGQ